MRMTCCTEKVMTTIRSFYLADIEAVYRELYMNMGHIGTDRTLHLIREGFYWSRMKIPININITIRSNWSRFSAFEEIKRWL